MAAETPRIFDRRDPDSPGTLIPSAIERHIQTVLVGLMSAALIWFGTKVTTTSDNLIALRAEASSEIAGIKIEIARLRTRLDGAQRAADLDRELAYRDRHTANIEERVRFLEQRMGLVPLPPWHLIEPKGPPRHGQPHPLDER